ncbi:MAG: CRISPR-associated endonuclease Cas2 [Candidatus Yonathbacteria bacterium CG_4_10_14_3_um_filter_47_65]|uniref:CRISPR-associated endonuclease Cas2 n=2 Tax=Parcubacteria group TaxID=1794811 RepID=A0A2M8D9K6_9BACT|nr:MAG: CRISPR-associated endonuclease Cas2 [Candidatus Nomurabacteria bacterium CG1_02_47_685]PIP04110.1 MAG: CRISPR-associated endonuclease Cas2 [Candidatus Yonathbacteria bacterium CG23_combo_of_CG06-09_8_20_14_all_46_18]PIQ32672.1 MAG: CRISPR-associated endonuclease Cas2 [Candidatus Yonathbacteria bacterium CG17_big_fil_post_rev_8_21_14_2_50_46_19]PIX56665.1 MAG: CRISPR-associated endonuclease Cas2 [Candidatus Yonathbacteria bacterium CG_4_10_14_3_um_filter_47_65]PIY57838.1 MAG: CRISPR-asso
MKKKQEKQSLKRIPIEKMVLGVVGAVGVIALVLVAPGIGPMFRLFGVQKKKYPSRYINSAIGRLKEKGYIVFEKKGGKKFIRLTKKGEVEFIKYHQGKVLPSPPKKWDKRWRIIIFDIPEKKRSLRDKVRENIAAFGFVRLQNSVWVYPYDCEELIIMLKAEYKIGKDLLYIVAEKIEYDQMLKKQFQQRS